MAYTYIPDEYGRPPHLRFDTPQDFVQYVRDIEAGKYPEMSDKLTPQTIEQARDIEANPEGWEMSGGHPTKKPDWLARNLPWLGPAAIGGGIAAAALPGLLAGSGAAGGSGAGAGSAASAAAPEFAYASTPIAAGGSVPSITGAAAGTGGMTAAGIGGASKNIFGKIMDVMNNPLVGAAGSALGAGANAAAHNRGVQFDADLAKAELTQQAERDYYGSMLAREQEGRAGQKQAFNMSQLAALINKNQGSAGDPTNPYSRAIAAPSDEQKQSATASYNESMQRLDGGNPLPMPQRVGTDVNLQDPGMFEQIAGIAGPALSAGSYLSQLRNRRTPYGTPYGTPVTS